MRGFVAVVLVVAVTTLAGCTGDPEPRFSDPTDSPSPSAPTSSAAAEPEPWEEKSKDGAVAFVGLWVDTFSDALLSGDTGRLTRLSDKRCVTCQNFIGRINDVYGRGGSYESGAWSVLLTDVAPGGNQTEKSLTLRVERDAEKYRERKAGPIKTFPRSRATFAVEVKWSEQGWQMTRMQLFA